MNYPYNNDNLIKQREPLVFALNVPVQYINDVI